MKQHISNAGWAGLAAGFRAAYGLINVLLVVRLLGPESYGQVVALLALFMFYSNLSTSIFTMLVVKLMASRDPVEKQCLTAAGHLWAIGSITVLIVMVAAGGILANASVIGLARLPGPVVARLMLLMSIWASLQIMAAFQSALLESINRFDLATKSQLLGSLAVLVSFAVAFVFAIDVSAYAYVTTLCGGAIVDLVLVWLTRRGLLAVHSGDIPLAEAVRTLWALFKSGSLLQATSLMNMFLEPLNKTLLGNFLDGSAVTIYDLAMKVVWGIQSLFAAATRVFLHIASKERGQLERGYLDSVRLLAVPTVLLHVFGCVFLSVLANHWIRLDAGTLAVFFAIASLSNIGMIGVSPLYNGLIGIEHVAFIFRTQARLAITNVVMSLCLIPVMGVVGAAFGLLLATTYNVFAILRKGRELTENRQLGRSILHNIGPRMGWAALLFGVAVFLGSDTRSLAIQMAVVACATALFLAEPFAGYVYRRLVHPGN